VALGGGKGADAVESRVVVPVIVAAAAAVAAIAAVEERCELDDGHDHGKGGALDGDKSLVHVDAHGVGVGKEGTGSLGIGVGVGMNSADNLDEKLLRIAGAEVEADGLEDQALKANDDFAWRLKDLRQNWVSFLPKYRQRLGSKSRRTLSSEVVGLSGFLTL
jgi:hypothetical protein